MHRRNFNLKISNLDDHFKTSTKPVHWTNNNRAICAILLLHHEVEDPHLYRDVMRIIIGR